MATTAMTLQAERWNDIILLFGTIADTADDDFSESFRPPASLGDIAVMEMLVGINGITTAIANAEVRGVTCEVLSQDLASVVDIIGVDRWVKRSATQLCAYISPDPLVLVRRGEVIRISGADEDTGTTADLFVYAKCVRVQPVVNEGAPIQLVR